MNRLSQHISRWQRLFLLLFALVFTADVMGIGYADLVPGCCVEHTDSELEDSSEEEIEEDTAEWYCMPEAHGAALASAAALQRNWHGTLTNAWAVPPTPPPERQATSFIRQA